MNLRKRHLHRHWEQKDRRGKMFHFDPCGVLCVLMIYFCMIYADYVVIVWLLFPVFENSFWGVFHAIVFNSLLLTTLVAHTRAMLSDPGLVPISRNGNVNNSNQNYTSDDSDSEEEAMIRRYERGTKSEWTMCTRCQSFRPPRAHHCRICKRCVRKMDHHCPWVNNCVGEYNQKYFLQFILYVAVTCFYAALILLLSWVMDDAHFYYSRSHHYNKNVNHKKVLHSIFLGLESALFGMFVIAVTCDQMSAIFTDETAVETVQRRGRMPERSRRPRASKVALMRQVCGPGPKILWLVPCRSSQKASTSRFVRSMHQLSQYDV